MLKLQKYNISDVGERFNWTLEDGQLDCAVCRRIPHPPARSRTTQSNRAGARAAKCVVPCMG